MSKLKKHPCNNYKGFSYYLKINYLFIKILEVFKILSSSETLRI